MNRSLGVFRSVASSQFATDGPDYLEDDGI